MTRLWYRDPHSALALADEEVEAIDGLLELSPSPTQQCDVQMLSESISELKDRVNGLEDRYGTPSHLARNLDADYIRITEK
ncbi:hypothetical protein N7447_004257 [Penicillium robsamsonii]|uniref:uncharacterized protein n=1 Tax=Penicillium robsamsonii TaxID=1792511 RepID=UPI0025491444|nr:uncharacterized protein N7447_004257 [Penicillium robsamsonii]KAJ5827494.1 hypothetical protein N7447_004257 [Penicillium robsamsonii]